MTLPTVKETTLPPEPVSHDPFIDGLAPPSPPLPPATRRIWD